MERFFKFKVWRKKKCSDLVNYEYLKMRVCIDLASVWVETMESTTINGSKATKVWLNNSILYYAAMEFNDFFNLYQSKMKELQDIADKLENENPPSNSAN